MIYKIQLSLALVLMTAGLSRAEQPESSSASTERPNVIVFYTDDQGSLDANCYGSKDLVTPTIDRLAATGVRFTQMYAPSAICSASRAGLMTGRYPARAGVPANVSDADNTEGLPHREITIADMLQSEGYRTAHIGKWHLGHRPETRPNGQGFDFSFGHMQGCIDNYSHFFYWNGPNRHDLWLNGQETHRDGEYFGDLMKDHCKRFITEKSEQPFFVYMAINWPHYPLQGSPKWRDYYQQKIEDPQRRRYAALMSTTDELMGEIIDHVDSLGQLENTLIIYQSDHGHSVEERAFGGGGNPGPYRGCKASLFEGGIRIPSVVSWPGVIPAGQIRDQAVTGCDWFPTIADYVGCNTSVESLDGTSIRSVIDSGDAPTPHDHLYWLLGSGKNAQWAVRKGDWKLLGNPRDPRQTDSLGKEDQLFLVDLSTDISESKNVSQTNPDKVVELKAIHNQIQTEIEKPSTSQPATTR